MGDEGTPHRMPRSAVKLMTRSELAGLRALYNQLGDVSAAAGEALWRAGVTPTVAAFQRYEALDARVLDIIERIKAIVG
jgi:hypothetical protein